MRAALIGRYRVPYPFERHDRDHPMLAQLARRLGRLDVLVMPRDGAPPTWRDGPLTVHYAPGPVASSGPPGFLAWAYLRLRALHREARIDVVNGSDIWGGVVGAAFGARHHVPLLAQLQGEFLPVNAAYYGKTRGAVLQRLAILSCRRASVVRCLYEASAADAVRVARIPRERVAVVPSRCDVERFVPSAVPSPADRILYVGNLVPGKGVDVLIAAFAAIARRRPSSELIVVGDGPMLQALRDRARECGVEERVTFRGRLTHSQLPGEMQAATMLTLPSYSEGTPRVVMEAMAAGIPVVASRVGGIPDMVDDGVTGYLVPPGDRHALAAAIERVLADPDWAATAGARARAVVCERFTLERHLAAMEALHWRCVGTSPTRAEPLSVQRVAAGYGS